MLLLLFKHMRKEQKAAHGGRPFHPGCPPRGLQESRVRSALVFRRQDNSAWVLQRKDIAATRGCSLRGVSFWFWFCFDIFFS